MFVTFIHLIMGPKTAFAPAVNFPLQDFSAESCVWSHFKRFLPRLTAACTTNHCVTPHFTMLHFVTMLYCYTAPIILLHRILQCYISLHCYIITMLNCTNRFVTLHFTMLHFVTLLQCWTAPIIALHRIVTFCYIITMLHCTNNCVTPYCYILLHFVTMLNCTNHCVTRHFLVVHCRKKFRCAVHQRLQCIYFLSTSTIFLACNFH